MNTDIIKLKREQFAISIRKQARNHKFFNNRITDLESSIVD